MNSEIYPLHLRGVGNSLSTTANWVFNFVVSISFLALTGSNLGEVLVWLLLALFALGTWLFAYFVLIETKGKKLEEILELLKANGKKSD